MDTDPDERHRLETYHEPHQVRQRIREASGHDRLRDAILGAVDGAITTFAVVAGSIGGGFSGTVIIVLGFANLLADGFSMAVSNYLGVKGERERVMQARHKEERHIELVPERQQDEVRQIFAEKGFSGDTLERIVETITSNRRMWVDTVVYEEFGLPLLGASPVRAGLVTFIAFLLVGAFPLLPFLFTGFSLDTAFISSIAVTGAAFLGIGMIKGRIVGGNIWWAGAETLLTGAAAALLAFLVGYGLRQWIVGGGPV